MAIPSRLEDISPAVPSLRAIPSTAQAADGEVALLTVAQRRRIAAIATTLSLGPRAAIFRAGEPAEYVFINGGGVVKTVHELANGKRQINAFWFPRDIFGLAENGRYVYSTTAVTAVTLYRVPVDALNAEMLADAHLTLQVLNKITHELRESQRQKLLLIRRDAAGRVAMFLRLLERYAPASRPADIISVPMSRSDIANYLGLTLEAVSRATRLLTAQGVIAFPDRHTIRILDRRRFLQIVAKI